MKDLLTTLQQKGIHLKLKGDDIKVVFKGDKPSPEVIQQLKENKTKLIAYLKKYDIGKSYDPIPGIIPQKNYKLSPGQQRLWVLSQFDEGSVAYNEPYTVELDEVVEVAKFEKAIRLTIERHEILRTVFKVDDQKEIKQWVLTEKELGFKIGFQDLSGEKNKETVVQDFISADAYLPFDLEKGPLIRASLLQLEKDKFIFYYNLHHIICDGWSLEVLSKDVMAFYTALKSGTNAGLSPLTIQYKDYTYWNSAQSDNGSVSEHRDFWLEHLRGELPTMDLPRTKMRPGVQTHNGHSIGGYLSPELTKKLKDFCLAHEGSLFMGLLASLNVLWYRYTSQTDLIFGTPVAGRNHPDLENQIGFYVNTLALRTAVDPDKSFISFFNEVKESTLAAFAHQTYPFDQLMSDLNLQRDMSRGALVDAVLSLQNFEEKQNQDNPTPMDFSEMMDIGETKSKFDFDLTVHEQENYLNFRINFNPDVYDLESIGQFLRHFKNLIACIVRDPQQVVAKVNYLDEVEKAQISSFNVPAEEVVSDFQHLACRFEKQVAATPNNTAVTFYDEGLSYQELNEKANQFARYLVATHKVGLDDLVGVNLEKSPWLVVAILSVFKSGAVYVPIDVDYPKERIDYISNDAGCKLVIDQDVLTSFEDFLGDSNICSKENLSVQVKEDSVAYIIYTSGSTGKPKGVKVLHKNLNHFFDNVLDRYGVSSTVSMPFIASHAFDISMFQLFTPILKGGCSQLINKEVFQDLPQFVSILSKSTALDTVPAVYDMLVNHILENQLSAQFDTITNLFIGGDKISDQLLMRLPLAFREAIVTVTYGPTEGTIFCTDAVYPKGAITQETKGTVIGKPMKNTEIYILDNYNQTVGIGIAGEICIGGAGVTLGYHNKVDITQERYVSLSGISSKPLYKTGDLAKFLSDGRIEFIGRKDNQLKIRGYRIESEEISRTMLSMDDVEEALIVDCTLNGTKELVGYFTSKSGVEEVQVKQFLQKSLPGYMVPVYVIALETFPLTPNGKVDRKNLPPPVVNSKESETYVPPRNKIEQKLGQLVANELRLERDKVGVFDNFFDLGANSIRIIKLLNTLNQEFGTDLKAVTLFQYPNINDLVTYVSGDQPDQREEEEDLPLGHDDIAIVGMSGRFPKSANLKEFWANLSEGKELSTFYTDEALKAKGIADDVIADAQFIPVKSAAEAVDRFDYAFFGYTEDEAKFMDPQIRVMHEEAWKALESAGHDPAVKHNKIGVFLAASDNLNWQLHTKVTDNEKVDSFLLNKISQRNFISTLISYSLNLKGPSIYIDTACSSSLVAVSNACKHILQGECNMALAGGVSIRTTPNIGYRYEEGTIMSSDGHCRPFDAKSSGTIEGEGAGVVVLKRLREALTDGDEIHAVIKGAATNNDGRQKVGFTAPSVIGQASCIRKAQRLADIPSESISYIETHGTATNLGDPIEIEALNKAFDHNTEHTCAIGSVKSNMGHLDAAAGVAGLIKTVLAMKYRKLPPSVNFENPNPEVNFQNGPFYVNNELKQWEGEYPLRAGVSSFGVGGTNAHVVLEEAPPAQKSGASKENQLLLWSAKTKTAVAAYRQALITDVNSHPDARYIADLAYTLKTKKANFKYRSYLTYDGKSPIEADSIENKIVAVGKEVPGIVFMFSGSGSQYLKMGKGIYETEPYFKTCLDKGFALLQKATNIDFRSVLYDEVPSHKADINNNLYTQPIIFIFEYALAKLLMKWGIVPKCMIGHSTGEYTAACISGVFDYETALQLVIKRADLMSKAPKGAMLTVGLTEEATKELLTDELSLAAVNSKEYCVVSGLPHAIDSLFEVLEAKGVPCSKLRISLAGHSFLMDEALDEFEMAVSKVQLQAPRIPFVSNKSGRQITDKEATSPAYWRAHLRQTVRFFEGIQGIVDSGRPHAFIEVGPGQVLKTFASQILQGTGHTVINTTRHPKEEIKDQAFLLDKLGELWCHGVAMDWNAFYEGQERYRVPAPTYAFTPHQLPTIVDPLARLNTKRLQGNHNSIEGSFYLQDWKKSVLQQQPVTNKAGQYVLFAHDEPWTKALRAKLGNAGNEITTIVQAKDFVNEGAHYAIDPSEEEHYDKLRQAIAWDNVDHLIYAWRGEATHPDTIAQEVVKLTYLAALLEQAKATVKVTLITQSSQFVLGDEPVSMLSNVAASTWQVLLQERHKGSFSWVDLDVWDESTASKVAMELTANATRYIAYRRGKRYDQGYQAIPLHSPDNSDILEKEGHYLVTGGLNTITSTLALHLMGKYAAKVCLIGDEPISEDTYQAFIQQLTTYQGYFSYHQVSLSDTKGLKSQIAGLEANHGTISGVLHTDSIQMGEMETFAPLESLDQEVARQHLHDQIQGINNIIEIFEEKGLSCLWVATGSNSIFGGEMQGLYSIVNTYIDARIQKLDREGWQSVNLDVLNQQDFQKESLGQIFESTVSIKEHARVVSSFQDMEGDITNLQKDRKIEKEHDEQQKVTVERPEMDFNYEAPATPTESKLVNIWEDFFGINQIGVLDSFFELGGDSLKGLVVCRMINKAFGVQINIKDFYKKPTVRKLAEEIDLVEKITTMQQVKTNNTIKV